MASMKETLAKRLVPAIVIAIVTGSVLIGVVGAGNATQEEAPVESIDVPRAMLGDAGSYTMELHGPWAAGPFTDHAAAFLNFTFEPGEPTRMADGLVHETDRVALEGVRYNSDNVGDTNFDGKMDGNPWEAYNGAVLFERGTPTVMALESNRTLTNATEGGLLGTGFSVGGPVPLGSQVLTHEKSQQRAFDLSGPSCLFVHPLQGKTVRIGSRFVLEDECKVGSLLELRDTTYTAKAFEEVGPGTALRFDSSIPTAYVWASVSGSISGGVPDVDVNVTMNLFWTSVWFVSGISAPVKVDARAENGNHLTLTLAGFQAGSEPRTRGAAPRDPLPTLETAPTQPWGPDDTGLVTDFLPSAAWNGALADPAFSGLRDYLASHPDAVTDMAYRFQFGGPTWWFSMTDGTEQYDVIITSVRATGLPPPFPAHYLRYAEFGGPREALMSTVPVVPDEAPTWNGLADRWRRYATADDAAHDANSMLYTVFAIPVQDVPVENLPDSFVFTKVGWVESTSSGQRLDTSTQPPTVVRDEQLRMSELTMVNGDASLLRTAQEDTTVRDGLPGSGSSTPSSAPASRPAGGLLPAWFPSPEQAAGISFVGIVAGALYWIWPVLKGGVVGLFSRVRSPELLQNPQRARIAAIVEAEPGIHFQELGRRSSIPNGTLVHHLGKLTHAGLVVARPYGGYTCYFPKSAGRIQMAAAPAMKSDGARAILAAVAAQPGLTSQQVAEHCRLQASTVTYHVKRLIEGGLVVASRDGRFVRLHPSPTAITMAGQAAAASA